MFTNKDGKTLCENCFSEISAEPCPHCGYSLGMPLSNAVVLSPGTILAGKYIVGKCLGAGGFGITYRSYHYQENSVVAIKEYFPKAIVHRGDDHTSIYVSSEQERLAYTEGASKFYREAEMVASFREAPGIVKVYEFFSENNTSYMVMEYLEGMDLRQLFTKRGNGTNFGQFSEEETLYILNSVLDSLKVVHSHREDGKITLHRDIAPDNIYLCADGRIKLIDFGAARQLVSNMSQNLSVIVKRGFAPPEQYQKKGNQGPWSDIYALGATAYSLLSGNMLDFPSGPHCNDTLLEKIGNSHFYGILKKCTEFRPEDRYANVESMQVDLQKLNLKPQKIQLPGYPLMESAEPKNKDIPKGIPESNHRKTMEEPIPNDLPDGENPPPIDKKLLYTIVGITSAMMIITMIFFKAFLG